MSEKIPEFSSEEYGTACWLVGRFMYHWALLEGALNNGVGKLLGMNTLEAAIANANMHTRSKIHIIKTLVDLKGGTADWAKQAIKDMDAVATLSDHRNTAVHVVFGPDGNGGVKFLSVKAKGKLKFPNIEWSPDDVEAHCKNAQELRKRVEAIVERLTKKPGGLSALLLEHSKQPPNELGPESPLGRLLLGALSSQQSTIVESPQTPQERKAK